MNMPVNYSFRQRMTGLRACPACNQKMIPLEGDFCDSCKEGAKKNKKGRVKVIWPNETDYSHQKKDIINNSVHSGDLWLFFATIALFLISVIFGRGTAQVILYIALGIFIAGFIMYVYLSPARRENRKIEREKKQQAAEDEMKRKQELKELEFQQIRDQYRQLRKEIEAMPQYQQWRQAVLEKFGRKCAVCGGTENIEVDHRYKSFYAIVRDNGITNTVQAYECAALWNVNNGAPICKLHHDQTKSSVHYNQNCT